MCAAVSLGVGSAFAVVVVVKDISAAISVRRFSLLLVCIFFLQFCYILINVHYNSANCSMPHAVYRVVPPQLPR